MADEPVAYDAFISYRRSDGTQAARRLRRMLRAYRLPRNVDAPHGGRRLNVFLDTVYERGAADFYEQTILPALKASRYLIVVATPDAVQRTTGEDWIAREIADFAAGPNSGNVIVVRAAGEFLDPLPADLLQRYPQIQIVDFRGSGPLSWLLPQRAARLADERIKIVGPLFGVPLDAMPLLRREEERQQMARLGTAAGVGFATLATVVLLSLYALKSQWDAQQALRQSFAAAQNTIHAVTEQYYEDEPIDSISRDVVLNQCDLSERLMLLTELTATAPTRLACAIEGGIAATQSADNIGGGRGQLDALLRQAETNFAASEAVDYRFLTVIRAGFHSWVQLETELGGDGADNVRDRFAAFERRFAGRLDIADRIEAEQAVGAYTTAHGIAVARAEALLASGAEAEAAAQYRLAAEDAGNAMTAVRALAEDERTAGTDAQALAYLIAARGEAAALQTRDPVAARHALAGIEAVAAAMPGDASGRRKAMALRAQAALGDGAIPVSGADAEAAARESLWRCLDLAAQSIGMAVEQGIPEGDEFLIRATEARTDCIYRMELKTDARVAALRKQQIPADATETVRELTSLLDDIARVGSYRPEPAVFDALFRVIILGDLAGVLQESGRAAEAEARRLEAARLYAPYIDTLDQQDLRAGQAADIERAWKTILDGHFVGHLDRMRDEATRAPGEGAVKLLRQILADDDAWDAAMPQRTQWDDVYQGEIRLQIGENLWNLGQVDAAYAEAAAAWAALEKYDGDFTASGDMKQRGDHLWTRLKTIIAERPGLAETGGQP